MIKFNYRLSLGLFWFRFTLHWNWFELNVCRGRGRGEGAGGGGGKNYGVECLGGRIDEGYSIGEPRVHLRKGGHYRGW